jgi:hypothetical protein
MKQMIILEEPLNPEIDEISSFLKEYQSIQVMKKELELREKLYKAYLLKTLPKSKENSFKDGKYCAYVSEVETKRADSEWVKNYFEKNLIEPPLKATKSYRLNVRIER